MRRSFLPFSLSLLLCALPVLCEKYHVHSQHPGNFIISTGHEKHGDLVETVPKSEKHFPHHTIVNIHPPISDTDPTEGVVSGKGGLFIGVSKDGKELEWHTEPHKWRFDPGTVDPYHVIFDSKNDNLWLDSICDDGIVELEEAPLTGPGDAFWRVHKARHK